MHATATNQRTRVSPPEVLAPEETSRVKMFIHKDPAEAENAVQEWLRQHPVNIHHIAQSQSERNGRFVFVLSLFYRTT